MDDEKGQAKRKSTIKAFNFGSSIIIQLSTNDMMQQKLDYVHENPVKAGFVAEPHHWLYSRALDYSGGKGLLEGIKLIA